MKSYDYDLIIVGAGVAGLAAATASARAGARVVIFDAAPQIAAKIKGEVIKENNTILQKILGEPMPHRVINGTSRRRRIVSPSGKKELVTEKEEASLLIEYHSLMHLLAKACVASGAELHLNTEAVAPLLDNEQVCGLTVKSMGISAEVRGKAVIAADGWNSRLRQQVNFPAPMVCPAYKAVVEGASILHEDMLEFFLLNDPAGAFWIFPKGKTSAECGITYWDTSAETKPLDLQGAWQRHRQENSMLRERLEHASPILTSTDGLVFGGLLQDFVRPGLVLVGDAAGQVGAKGASGILSSLSMGYEAGNFLGAYAAEHHSAAGMQTMQECMTIMKSTGTWSMLEAEEKSGMMTRHFLFKTLKTNKAIDDAWDAIAEMA